MYSLSIVNISFTSYIIQRMSPSLHSLHTHTLTFLVTVDPTKALRTAAIVASKQVLEMRRQGMLLVHTVTHSATMLHGCWYTSTRLLITHCTSPSIHAGAGVTLICLSLTVDSLKPCCTQTLILIRSSIVACCTILTQSGVPTTVKICSRAVVLANICIYADRLDPVCYSLIPRPFGFSL